MASPRTVLLAGATGLIGSACLNMLLRDEAVERAVVLARRPLPDINPTLHPKLDVRLIDFERLEDHADLFAVDQILCTLGTTIKQAGSQEQFRKVDFGYPLRMADLGLDHGVKHFLLVTALGANPSSRFFYNRVKGELEQAVLALPYRSITLLRPSLLLGERQEFRLGEEAAKRFSFLIPGKYKPVQGRDVAAALVQAAKADKPGRWIVESDAIRRMAAE